ncbi:MAG TPA: CdaR family protein [Leptospiraceae bacterium]|nr:CdaR family protein [Leptospiraceae bacterium]HNN60983.1 CdaR family protein [Leptospiraceae bacterium]HNN76174.1 CdaR family protein [Leptospiraceae bacterium]
MSIFRRLLRSLTWHWKEKIICLLMASGLWFYVDNLKIGTISLNVPVSYRNKPVDLDFAQDPPRFIEVKLRGDKERLNFPTTKLRAEVDLKGATAERKTYAYSIDTRLFPENVEMVDTVTSLHIQLEKSMVRFVVLKATTMGSPKSGFKRGRVLIMPDRAKVQGGTERMQSVREIMLPPIDITGASSNVMRSVPVVEPPGTTLLSPPEVEVTVVIVSDEKESEKTLEIPVTFRNASPGVTPTSQTRTVRVTVHGDSDMIKDVGESDVDAFLDLAGLDLTGDVDMVTFEIPVRVVLRKPGKGSVVSADPDFAVVRFDRKK